LNRNQREVDVMLMAAPRAILKLKVTFNNIPPMTGRAAMGRIGSVEKLEQVVGSPPLGSLLKSIDALDAHCEQLLALSPFAVIGLREDGGGARAAALGGAPGFARVESRSRLRVPLPADATLPSAAAPAALIFFVPGLGETLRVNGRAVADGGALRVEVEEAFVHCAKALIRSALWQGGAAPERPVPPARGAGPLADEAIRDFLGRAPFAVVTSSDAAGAADASPKGDPEGFLAVVDGTAVALPDRPGNHRTDTFHNVLEDPATALLALVPGDPRALELSGRARLTDDPALLATMAVQGKVPKLALLLDVERAVLAPSAAIAAAELWNPARVHDPATLPKMARVLIDHVKLNKQRGIAAAAMRKLASERVLGPALARDYKNNLY
jgi:predicted pyridoxine 5'-phosphate oxidase superfamily flavin-nucleotide-binding protein